MTLTGIALTVVILALAIAANLPPWAGVFVGLGGTYTALSLGSAIENGWPR